MRSLDLMLYSVFTGKHNPERTKTGVFVSQRRQEKLAAITAKQNKKNALRAKLGLMPKE